MAGCWVGGPAQGLCKPRGHRRGPKDAEYLRTADRLDYQPHLSAHSHSAYIFRRAFPVRVGAPTLQAIRGEA